MLAPRVNFGKVDCACDAKLAKSIWVLNVPAVAYYFEGKLVGVLVGARQNIQRRLEHLLYGEQIGHDNALGPDV